MKTRMGKLPDNVTRFRLEAGIDMKLEIDLLRDLLLYIEKNAVRPESQLEDIAIGNWSGDQIAYHVVLAEESGLIKATIESLPDNDDDTVWHVGYVVHRLTAAGHELLGTIREPRHWRAVKEGSKKAGLATLSAIASFAEAYVKMKANQYLGLGTAGIPPTPE